MLHIHTNHQPYDLTTEHGRAQSFAHGKWAATIAEKVDVALAENSAKVKFELHALIESDLVHISEDFIKDHNVENNLLEFAGELGKRDQEVFKPITETYLAQREESVKQFKLLMQLVEKIKKHFDLE